MPAMPLVKERQTEDGSSLRSASFAIIYIKKRDVIINFMNVLELTVATQTNFLLYELLICKCHRYQIRENEDLFASVMIERSY